MTKERKQQATKEAAKVILWEQGEIYAAERVEDIGIYLELLAELLQSGATVEAEFTSAGACGVVSVCITIISGWGKGVQLYG